jgi:hypothetical protein
VSYRQLSININRNHLQEMGELNMQTMTGNMKTTIVCDEENEHTFSITKKLGNTSTSHWSLPDTGEGGCISESNMITK